MRYGLILVEFVLLIASVGPSCKKNHYRINASSKNARIEIKRLEQDLFSINPNEIKNSIPKLKNKYQDFLRLFSYVINTGDINDSSFGDFLVRFCTDKLNNEVYASVMKLYPDISRIQNNLSDAFSHYLYYFPGRKVPAVYTCITGFNNSIITGDSVLGIGLDRYLGASSDFYRRLEIYKYMAERMTAENIVPDCMYAWATKEWDFKNTGYKEDNVLAEIIHEGKLLYFVKSMLSEYQENLVFGFTSEQLKFCVNNEGQMWQYLVENNLLFSTDQLTKRKLVSEAPFTSYFTKESPGKAATWLGFRIIDSFMQNSKGLSIVEMMKETDVQGILEKARYSPR